MQSQAVTLSGISKRFETVIAVDDVSLEVRSVGRRRACA